MRFKVGQEVFVLYKLKFGDGHCKWFFTKEKQRIVDIKYQKYYFEKHPYIAGKKDVCSTQKGAVHVCKTRNQKLNNQDNKNS